MLGTPALVAGVEPARPKRPPRFRDGAPHRRSLTSRALQAGIEPAPRCYPRPAFQAGAIPLRRLQHLATTILMVGRVCGPTRVTPTARVPVAPSCSVRDFVLSLVTLFAEKDALVSLFRGLLERTFQQPRDVCYFCRPILMVKVKIRCRPTVYATTTETLLQESAPGGVVPLMVLASDDRVFHRHTSPSGQMQPLIHLGLS